MCVDEQLVPFRGRCSFLQYLPSKPDRYGLKIYWAVDVETNFPLYAEPYLGRPLGQERQVNLGRNMAIKLSEPFFRTGRNITTDNFFTDIELADTLHKNGLTLVGTVRGNKRFLPEQFKQKRSQVLHGSTFVFQENTTLVNYQSKRDKHVVVLSTMHHDKSIDPESFKQKPDIVTFYNSTKGAVDAMDKMAHSYTTKRSTQRWPMVIFFNVLDLSTIAARVIWSKKFPDDPLSGKDSRSDFIIKVAEELSVGQMQRRLFQINLPRSLKASIESFVEHIEGSQRGKRGNEAPRAGKRVATPSTSSSSTPAKLKKLTSVQEVKKQGRCGECDWKKYRKSRNSCNFCKTFLCKDHAKLICSRCSSIVE